MDMDRLSVFQSNNFTVVTQVSFLSYIKLIAFDVSQIKYLT